MDTISIVPLHGSHKICLKDIRLNSDFHKNRLCSNNIVRHSQCHLINNIDVRFPNVRRIKFEPFVIIKTTLQECGVWLLQRADSANLGLTGI